MTHASGLLTARNHYQAYPRGLLKMEIPEREGVSLLRFLISVGWTSSGTFPRGLFKGKVKEGITVGIRNFPESVLPVSFCGGYRQHQHLLSSLIRLCGTCSLAPAHTERLQGRAGRRRAEMGSVSTGRDVGSEKQLLAGTAPGIRHEQVSEEL